MNAAARPGINSGGTRAHLDCAETKVDADGRDVALGEGIVRESQQKARLADTRVSDEDQFKPAKAVTVVSACCACPILEISKFARALTGDRSHALPPSQTVSATQTAPLPGVLRVKSTRVAWSSRRS